MNWGWETLRWSTSLPRLESSVTETQGSLLNNKTRTLVLKIKASMILRKTDSVCEFLILPLPSRTPITDLTSTTGRIATLTLSLPRQERLLWHLLIPDEGSTSSRETIQVQTPQRLSKKYSAGKKCARREGSRHGKAPDTNNGSGGSSGMRPSAAGPSRFPGAYY
jgi:hypothetical protein